MEKTEKNKCSIVFVDGEWVDRSGQLLTLDDHKIADDIVIHNNNVIRFKESGTYSVRLDIECETPTYGANAGGPADDNTGYGIVIKTTKSNNPVMVLQGGNRLSGAAMTEVDAHDVWRVYYEGQHYNFPLKGYLTVINEKDMTRHVQNLSELPQSQIINNPESYNEYQNNINKQIRIINPLQTIGTFASSGSADTSITFDTLEEVRKFTDNEKVVAQARRSEFEGLSELDIQSLRKQLIKDGQMLRFKKDTGQFAVDISQINPELISSLKMAIFGNLTDEDKEYLRDKLIKTGPGVQLNDGVVSLDMQYIKDQLESDIIEIKPTEVIYQANPLIDRDAIKKVKGIFGKKKKIAKNLQDSIDTIMWSVFDYVVTRNDKIQKFYVLDNYAEDVARIYNANFMDINITRDEVIASARRWVSDKPKAITYEVTESGRWTILRKISNDI